MKVWKTAREIESFLITQMQERGACADVASVAVEVSGAGWVARLVPSSSSDQCKREFEAICRIAQDKFDLAEQH